MHNNKKPKINLNVSLHKFLINSPIIANGYAHRIPHKPSSNRFDSGPQIFRKSFEFQPKGKATHPTIILIAENKYLIVKIRLRNYVISFAFQCVLLCNDKHFLFLQLY